MQDFSNTAKYPQFIYNDCIDNDSCYIQVRCSGKCPLDCPDYRVDKKKRNKRKVLSEYLSRE